MYHQREQWHGEMVLRDPIHRYIHVQDAIIRDLIDAKEMQRLRRIKQLGTASTTFPGAEHSRFNHSLGVYELTRRIIDDVFSKYPIWNTADRLLALSAGLLHDVGHGPFSHSFEKAFSLNHENFSCKIILGNTEINSILKRVSINFPEQVASVIQKKHKNKLIVGLISGQVDADRMDYLLRDSYYTGVSYGKFDLERMLRVICPSKNGIVIKESGIHAVEDYIMCRYQMYSQIYFHPTSNSTEVLLTNIFKRVKHLFFTNYKFKTSPTHFISILNDQITISDYLSLDETICLFYFSCWQSESDPILSDLCTRFITRNQFQHVAYVEKDENKNYLELLKNELHTADIDTKYYLTINPSYYVAYDYYDFRQKHNQPVAILEKNGVISDLSTKSEIIAAINGKQSVYKYLYYPKNMIEKLPKKKQHYIFDLLAKISN